MSQHKPESIKKIERRMEGVEEGSLRHRVLTSVVHFKTSWIDLGRHLFTVWSDKHYKAWGYLTFDAYTAKEIGIRKPTALKLLRSYRFLEKEEPAVLRFDEAAPRTAATAPTWQSLDLLRRAKENRLLDETDYRRVKGELLEEGKDLGEVKRDLTHLIKERREEDPEEARRKRKMATVKRFLSTLKSLKRDMELLKLVPRQIVKETESLIRKLEAEIG